MKPRIIILEDDDSSRSAISIYLEKQGYEVISAPEPMLCPIYLSPTETCPHTDACGDFLLTDNQMPKMSGLEFVEAQSQRGCKGVVRNKAVMSGLWTDVGLKKAEKLGCKVFKKPFDIDELIHFNQWLKERTKEIPPDRKLADLEKK